MDQLALAMIRFNDLHGYDTLKYGAILIGVGAVLNLFGFNAMWIVNIGAFMIFIVGMFWIIPLFLSLHSLETCLTLGQCQN